MLNARASPVPSSEGRELTIEIERGEEGTDLLVVVVQRRVCRHGRKGRRLRPKLGMAIAKE